MGANVFQFFASKNNRMRDFFGVALSHRVVQIVDDVANFSAVMNCDGITSCTFFVKSFSYAVERKVCLACPTKVSGKNALLYFADGFSNEIEKVSRVWHRKSPVIFAVVPAD